MITITEGDIDWKGTKAQLMAEFSTIAHAFCVEGVCDEEEALEAVKLAFNPDMLMLKALEKLLKEVKEND